MVAEELKELPELRALLQVCREVIRHDERMRSASTGSLGTLADLARCCLEVWECQST